MCFCHQRPQCASCCALPQQGYGYHRRKGGYTPAGKVLPGFDGNLPETSRHNLAKPPRPPSGKLEILTGNSLPEFSNVTPEIPKPSRFSTLKPSESVFRKPRHHDCCKNRPEWLILNPIPGSKARTPHFVDRNKVWTWYSFSSFSFE